MKSFFVLSFAAHGAFLAALIVLGTLLSKPRMSYYAVDLFSAPAGGGVRQDLPFHPLQRQRRQLAKAKAMKVPKVAVSAPRAAEEELPDQDTIRMLAKLKKKRMGLIKSQPSATREKIRFSGQRVRKCVVFSKFRTWRLRTSRIGCGNRCGCGTGFSVPLVFNSDRGQARQAVASAAGF